MFPEDVASIWSAEVWNTVSGDETFRNRYRGVDAVEVLTNTVKVIENNVWTGFSCLEGSDGIVGKELLDDMFGVILPTGNESIAVKNSASTDVVG